MKVSRYVQMKKYQNRFMDIKCAKDVAVIILCFSLVVVIDVPNMMMSSSSIILPTFVLVQEEQNFTASLISQDEVPTTNSKATGNSTFIL